MGSCKASDGLISRGAPSRDAWRWRKAWRSGISFWRWHRLSRARLSEVLTA